MPNYVPPRLSNANVNSASPHSIGASPRSIGASLRLIGASPRTNGASPRSVCTSPSYHQVKTNSLTLADSSHQAHIRPIDSPPRQYDGATFLSVLLNNIKTITIKEDSINKEVVSTITQEEESRSNNVGGEARQSRRNRSTVLTSPAQSRHW